jgi:hypothetical protein
MTEENKVVNVPVEVASEGSNELVPQQETRKAVSIEVDAAVRDLGAALMQLSSVVKDIAPQDLVFEYTEDHSAARSTRSLRLRAYRKV